MNNIKYSVVIPHKNSLDTLPRLINSIPLRDDIEIIVVDNSINRIECEAIKIKSDRDIIILYSEPDKFAGGARNVGIDHAHGEWLIFADSDDFFEDNAFDYFDKYKNENADIVYFKSNSVYDDTLEQCDRHIPFLRYIEDYQNNKMSDLEFKLSMVVPWAKMIKKSLVAKYNIQYDEVLAANDVMFSIKTGYFAKHFMVCSDTVYVVTMRRGSLSQRWDYPIIKSRYLVSLRRNKFLKENQLAAYQCSVMLYLVKSFSYGIKVFCEFLSEAINYKQNIFIGWQNWTKSMLLLRSNFKKNKKYLIR